MNLGNLTQITNSKDRSFFLSQITIFDRKKMIQFAHLNGNLVALNEAQLKVGDLAILRGYGIFDYFPFQGGQPLFLEDYINRFIQSAQTLHLDLPIDKDRLIKNVFELIAANEKSDGSIRLVATGGYAHDGYSPTEPNLIILQYAPPTYPEIFYSEGVHLLSYQYQRELPRAKTINYLKGISVIPALKKANAIEALYHDGQFLRETVRANFFLVTPDNKLVTPKEKILLGITRKTVLGLAKSIIEVEEREVAIEEIQTAKEAFLTSSTRNVMPVVMVDNQKIGNGIPGPVTQQLMVELKKAKNNYVRFAKQLQGRQS